MLKLKKTGEEIERELNIAKMHEERSMQLERERKGEKVIYPSTWEPQTSNCELKEVAEYSEEFSKVSSRMKETMPHHKIKKIER